MANLTRDPFHPMVGSYTKNMNKLTIKVDGEQVNSKDVLNVYRTSRSERPPRVEMMLRDESGKVITTFDEEQEREIPATFDLVGEITVQGTAKHCGCYKKRKIEKWWERITGNVGSW